MKNTALAGLGSGIDIEPHRAATTMLCCHHHAATIMPCCHHRAATIMLCWADCPELVAWSSPTLWTALHQCCSAQLRVHRTHMERTVSRAALGMPDSLYVTREIVQGFWGRVSAL